MKHIDGKSWLIIAASFMISYWGYWLHQKWTAPVAMVDESFDYEMPRPQSYYGEYDLSGRPVNRVLIGGEEAQKDQKTVAKLKPDEVVKNQAAADAKKKEDAKKAAQKKKKAKVDVQVVDTSKAPTLTVETIENSDTTSYIAQQDVPVVQQPKPTLKNPDINEDQVANGTQWRELLLSHPTQENAQAFDVAYKQGEVTEAQFKTIVAELLKDSTEARRDVALYLLGANPSASSFQLLVQHMSSIDSSQQAAFRTKYIDRYSDSTRITALVSVFSSKDKAVLTEATRILAVVVAKVQQTPSQQPNGGGNVPSGGERGRNLAATQVNSSSLSGFIPGLQSIVQSNDPALSPQAQNLLSSIQSLLNV